MGDRVRYGDDVVLTRATRRAAARVAVAVGVTALLVIASVALVGAKFGLYFFFHGAGGLLSAGLGIVHWWGAALLLLLAVGIVTANLLRRPPRPGMPRHAYALPPGHPALQALTRLSVLADVPAPRLLLVDSEQLNAFVVDDPGEPISIVLTEAALMQLPPEQLEAVLAHELFHVAHGDTRLTRRLEQLSDVAEDRSPAFGSGFVARSVRVMMRQRELSADRAAALLTGRPAVLLAAVERCAASTAAPGHDLREVGVGFVADDPAKPFSRPLDTHPTVAERAEVLARVAASLGA